MTFEKINVGAGTVTPTYVNCNCSNATMQQRILALLTDIAQINHNLIIQNKK